MDETIRDGAAASLASAIATALLEEHRYQVPSSYLETIRRVSREHVVVVVDEAGVLSPPLPPPDPDATTVRITPAELLGEPPPEKPPGRVGRKG